MNDETEKTVGPEATPNRGRRREAPILEGAAISSEPAAAKPEAMRPETLAPETVATETIAPLGRDGAEPARDRSRLTAALPGIAALLLSGAALYLAANPEVPDPARHEDVAALGQRLDRLESRLGALEAKPAPATPALPDLAPLNGRLDAATKAAEAARADAGRALQLAQNPLRPPEAPRVDLAPLDQRVGRLESRLDTELGPLRAALAAPKTEVRATETPDAQGVASRDFAAWAVIAQSLRQQIDRGAPFTREVSALEKLGADPARLGRLKPLAASGAPSAARLAQEFEPLSSSMLRAARPARAENGDVMDRIARSAANLVRIRPAGESAGDDAPALVGRTQAALQRGDVAEALATFDRLPDDIKAPARDWAVRARQRVDADAAARSLLDDALDSLARK